MLEAFVMCSERTVIAGFRHIPKPKQRNASAVVIHAPNERDHGTITHIADMVLHVETITRLTLSQELRDRLLGNTPFAELIDEQPRAR